MGRRPGHVTPGTPRPVDRLTAQDLVMATNALPKPLVAILANNLLVDRLTAEIASLFSDGGIDCMLIKGPAIGAWLWPDEVRGYGDSDLLVSPASWAQAKEMLEEAGFLNYQGPLDHPRMGSFASTEFWRGSENVDLHSTLAGLEAAPDQVWESLWQRAGQQQVGGQWIAVPDRPSILMNLPLHVVNHLRESKPKEDLRRGIHQGGLEQWQSAAQLADELSGLAAFATGLRTVPEGLSLARVLGIEEGRSVQFDLRATYVPTAEGLNELLSPELTISRRGALVRREIFPTPAFMRWWAPLARRGTFGLLLSYPYRWAWLALKVPAGLHAVHRARRWRSPTQLVGGRPRVDGSVARRRRESR